MSQSTVVNSRTTRRQLLRGAAAGGATAAAAVLLSGPSARAATLSAPGGGPGFGQVSGVDVVIDASHATRAVVQRFQGYFQAKSDRDPVKQMSFFSRKPLTYIDATLGWHWYTWEALLKSLEEFEPTWPKTARSYPYWILGDTTSAIVAFTDGAGTFFNELIDTVGCVNFGPDGKIERWVDYWDGRHSGIANVKKYRYPASQWPANFREDTVGETASPELRRVVYQLAAALRHGDATATAALLSPNVVFDDIPAHIHMRDQAYVAAYLTKAPGLLPYTGPGTAVRHILGTRAGGGYEWTAARGPVARGVTVIELDPWGKISRLAVMWDGSLVDDASLTLMAQKSIEQ